MGFDRVAFTPYRPDLDSFEEDLAMAEKHLERCREQHHDAAMHVAAAEAWVELARLKLEGWKAQEDQG